jgi:RNA polymerase sigma-70 factor (ECF subfamily)
MYLRSAWHSRGQSLDEEWTHLTPGRAEQSPPRSTTDDAIDLDAALASLPAVSRTVVWLHDVEGFTHKEIAELMGKSESFSKSQLSRAYSRLRPILDQHASDVDSVLAAHTSCNATN